MADIDGFLQEIAGAVGTAPFTASSLAMRDIYVPRGTTLQQLHAAGLIESAGTAWRLAPGVAARLRTNDQVTA
ncbi:MAG: hypothetical protein WC277_10335 [Bacilli bacterium]